MSMAPETVEVTYVTPRHLAGSGDPGWITVPVHHRTCRRPSGATHWYSA